MAKTLTLRQKRKVLTMYTGKIPIKKISRVMEISINTVYTNGRAIQRGFESPGAYLTYLAEKRKQQPKNKAFSYFIRKRLEEILMNQSQLSREIGRSREAVSKYYHGELVPNSETIKRIYIALGCGR